MVYGQYKTFVNQLIMFNLHRYVIQKPKNLIDVLKEDIWNGIQKLKDRAVKIDGPKMIAVDMTVRVTVH